MFANNHQRLLCFFITSVSETRLHIHKNSVRSKGIWRVRSFFSFWLISECSDRGSSKSSLIRFSNRKNGFAPINISPERILERYFRPRLYTIYIEFCFLSANHWANVRVLTSPCNTPIAFTMYIYSRNETRFLFSVCANVKSLFHMRSCQIGKTIKS